MSGIEISMPAIKQSAPEASLTNTLNAAISTIEKVNDVNFQCDEKSTKKPEKMEEDIIVSTIKPSLGPTRLYTPLKRKMVNEIFGQEALEPKLTRRRLSIVPIQN